MQVAEFFSPPSGILYLFQLPASVAPSNALPYSQPPPVELLTLLSFLFLLNAARVFADYALHAGLIAEIGLGVVYGTPLAALLPKAWEASYTALGYLGLIGIVFEGMHVTKHNILLTRLAGGLSTDLDALLSHLPLSIVCAFIGITFPIALSFALLQGCFGYQPLETFAAGAALASTSLGTTLMALNSVSHEQSDTTAGELFSPRRHTLT